MMFGRSGALIGNLLFPLLMSYGCIGPFLMIGVPSLGKTLFANLNRFMSIFICKIFSLQFNLYDASKNNKKATSIIH